MIDRHSLRLRLLLGGLLGVALAALVAALWLGEAFAEASERAFDRQLQQELESLLASAEVDEAGRFELRSEPEDRHYAQPFSGHYWWVTVGDRRFRSRSLWDGELAAPLPERAGPARSLDLTGPRGEPLRARLQAVRFPRLEQPAVFLVAADRTQLSADAARFRRVAAVTVAIVAGGLLLVLVLMVMLGLRPLSRLAEEVTRVRRGEIDRLATGGLPSEVAPLAGHLNELLEHHDRTVRRARTAAQDLAHALKTPLTVLSLEAERPGPRLPEVVREQVAQMRASVDRHLGRSVTVDQRARTGVAPVVERLLALMAKVHGDRNLRFEGDVPGGLVFAGGREDLEEMLGNLLDNAGKWARAQVRVGAGREGERLWIEVADDGPGLPAEASPADLGRGVRLDQRTPGSGLGLAIVQEIAEGYGGRLRLDSSPAGLRARLELPAG